MTHLATVFFLQGREDACRSVAAEALETIDRRLAWHPRFAAHRAQLVLQLANLSGLPWAKASDERPHNDSYVHTADLTLAFWTRMRDARLALVDGSVMNAERLLQTPIEAPSLPEHVRAVVIIERAFLAALAEDRQTLVGLTLALEELGLSGEAALLRGLYADLTGDRRAATDHFSTAAATVRINQPPCRALALTCEAQLRDALGQRDAALRGAADRGHHHRGPPECRPLPRLESPGDVPARPARTAAPSFARALARRAVGCHRRTIRGSSQCWRRGRPRCASAPPGQTRCSFRS